MAYKAGSLEFVFRLTDRETGEKVDVTSTPAMWAHANEYYDRLIAKGGHTQAWTLTRYLTALAMLAAAKAQTAVKVGDPFDLVAQAEFSARFEAEDVTAEYIDEADEAENPTKADQEDGQAAR